MVIKTVREYALQILARVETEESFPNLLLERILKSDPLSSKDSALLTELVNGTIKMQMYLDWVLKQFLHGSLKNLTPWIRNDLRLAVYQLLLLERIPDFAVVDEAVTLAKQYGHRGVANLVNGTLRNISRKRTKIRFPNRDTNPEKYIAIKYSHPQWMIQRWRKRWGDKSTIAFCDANNAPPPITIRTNLLRLSCAELTELLQKEQFNIKPTPDEQCLQVLNPASLTRSVLYNRGFFYIQDVSWAFIVKLLDPQPAERILDYCSAPGGKATHIAERMNNRGEIIALDIYDHRLNRLQENCKRLGTTIVDSYLVDKFDLQKSGKFDRIMVDVPCSGLGVLRRRADARWRHAESEIPEIAKKQLQILTRAAKFLKKNGIIVYSTCTTESEENEEVIAAFCRSYPEFKRESAGRWVPSFLIDSAGALRTMPHLHKMDGAFAVRLRKNG